MRRRRPPREVVVGSPSFDHGPLAVVLFHEERGGGEGGCVVGGGRGRIRTKDGRGRQEPPSPPHPPLSRPLLLLLRRCSPRSAAAGDMRPRRYARRGRCVPQARRAPSTHGSSTEAQQRRRGRSSEGMDWMGFEERNGKGGEAHLFFLEKERKRATCFCALSPPLSRPPCPPATLTTARRRQATREPGSTPSPAGTRRRRRPPALARSCRG